MSLLLLGVDSSETDGGTYEYPEPEVDSMRTQRDAHLVRYLADVERKEAMLAKMNANDSESKSSSNGGDDSKSSDIPDKKERKERSSRK